jgi:photosystem II stability/assembly factor-like uncharacterized protein
LKAIRIAALAVLLCPVLSFAQDIDTQVLNGLHWRLIGSFRGGRVSAVAGVADNPNVYYFGTPGGGIWKTTDAGQTWQPIFDKERVASIGSLAVAPSDSKMIFAGTGEQTGGNGVYRSTDEGQTWTHIGLDETRFIQAVIVDPHNPNIIVAGANSIGVFVFSRPYPTGTFTTPRGVFKSTDGGKTWKQTLSRDDSAGVFDMTADPSDAKILYASVLVPAPTPPDTGAKPDAESPKDTSVLYKSTDEGSTWTPMATSGMPAAGRGRMGITVAAGTRGRRLYAIIDQGFYRSDDAGATWTQSTKDPRIIGSDYFSRLFADTKNPDILYAAQTSLYRSTDGGHTFNAYVGAPSGDDFHVLWIDPNDNRRLFLGVDQGAIISVDAGKSWSSWYNQPTGQYYHVSTDNVFPYRTYAAQQDSGTQSVPSRSDYGEITPGDVTSTGGFEYCFIAPDPLHPDWIYSGGWYGTVIRLDRKTGQTATVFEKGAKYRAAQMPPLFFSPHDPHTLFVAMQMVLKTADDGRSWRPISPDLTVSDASGTAEPRSAPVRPAAIDSLAESPLDANILWAATTNRIVQLTRDGGVHWQKVTPPGINAPLEIFYVDPSHFDPAEAFLSVGSSRQAASAQILRTRDYGATWQPIIDGLPHDGSVRVVREDTVRKGLLFAGTDSTMYVSFDDGDHWRPFTLNLPATPITDIDVHGDDLVISTYGRGLWILDDISPIRQIKPELIAAPAHLFQPVDATRVRWDTWGDTPLPIETPTAKNPPDGAMIDYHLKANVTGEASIIIRDAAGNTVRKYTGHMPEPNLPLPNVPEYWFAQTVSVDGSAGLHRFVWDLRTDSPRALPASYFGPILQYTEYTLPDHAIPYETPRQQPQGPLVVPGDYTIELTADGQTLKQPLHVSIDPRVTASQADLEAQFALAQRIEKGMNVSYDVYQQVTALSTALEVHKKDPAATAASAELEKQIQAVEDGPHDAPGLGPLNRDLSRLLNGVEGGDQRPTDPQMQAVTETCAALDKALALWKSLNDSLKANNPLNLPVASLLPASGCSE